METQSFFYLIWSLLYIIQDQNVQGSLVAIWDHYPHYVPASSTARAAASLISSETEVIFSSAVVLAAP
jgi:hypothetical protein